MRFTCLISGFKWKFELLHWHWHGPDTISRALTALTSAPLTKQDLPGGLTFYINIMGWFLNNCTLEHDKSSLVNFFAYTSFKSKNFCQPNQLRPTLWKGLQRSIEISKNKHFDNWNLDYTLNFCYRIIASLRHFFYGVHHTNEFWSGGGDVSNRFARSFSSGFQNAITTNLPWSWELFTTASGKRCNFFYPSTHFSVYHKRFWFATVCQAQVPFCILIM